MPPSDDFVPESVDYNIEDLDLPDCINLENLPDGIVASDLDGIPEDLLRSVYCTFNIHINLQYMSLEHILVNLQCTG